MNPSYKFVDCTEGRTIVVGDIHGCYAELQLLLIKMNEVLIKIPFIKSINEIEKNFRELEDESL